ncbi:ROK family protein [Anaerostipes sp.]|uniref:ROK family protein n=1 Tax=Anaerostipes sp. TaxID=1872530 RepID=UPI0025BE05A1|nr:ROK family protein [Anaerostipes sp.]MBS7009264.1 ROK family protein [Anaerostipes sp.]
MKKQKQQDQQQMKISNRQLVLDKIKSRGNVSRASLAKELKMSPTSMTRICADLSGLNFIKESQGDSKGVGRKAFLLERNPRAFYSLGILVRRDFISFLIMDYGEQILGIKKWNMSVGGSPEDVAELIKECFDKCRAELPEIMERVKAAGVSFPGVVSAGGANIIRSGFAGWEQTDFKDLLKRKLGIHICLENDVKASVLEEYFHYPELQVNRLGFLSLSIDVGAAFMNEGRVMEGACGDIAHKILIYGGRKCSCHKEGCVSAYLSAGGILKQAEEMGERCADLNDIADAYERKEGWAQELMVRLAGYTALLLEDMMAWNNPEIILLGGRTVRCLPMLLDEVLKRQDIINPEMLKETKICESKNAGNESMLGAAYLAMENYEKIRLDQLRQKEI